MLSSYVPLAPSNHLLVIITMPTLDSAGADSNCPCAQDWPMATAAGIGLFLRPDVNQYLRSIIKEYGSFLGTPESTSVLNTDATGWFNQDALNVMVNVAAPPPQPQ